MLLLTRLLGGLIIGWLALGANRTKLSREAVTSRIALSVNALSVIELP
jgi:hypothetical protein